MSFSFSSIECHENPILRRHVNARVWVSMAAIHSLSDVAAAAHRSARHLVDHVELPDTEREHVVESLRQIESRQVGALMIAEPGKRRRRYDLVRW
jgi:hypothetical protein